MHSLTSLRNSFIILVCVDPAAARVTFSLLYSGVVLSYTRLVSKSKRAFYGMYLYAPVVLLVDEV